jgi:hypothetical protein
MAQLQTAGGFFVEVGPQFGFMISSKMDMETGNDPDIEDYVKKTDVAAAAGIGYLSRVGLGLNARYTHGFSNVWNADDSPSQPQYEISNRVVSIGLTYHFGANK